jgi:hypothetical protein
VDSGSDTSWKKPPAVSSFFRSGLSGDRRRSYYFHGKTAAACDMKTLRNHFSFQEIRKNAGKPGRFYFFGGYQKKTPRRGSEVP